MKKVKVLVCSYHALLSSYLLVDRKYFEFAETISENFIFEQEVFNIEKEKLEILNNKIKNLESNCWVDIDGYVNEKGRVDYDGPYYYLINGYKDEHENLFICTEEAKV